MDTKNLTGIVIALVIGFGLGYIMPASTPTTTHDTNGTSMSHTMDSMTDRLKGKTGAELEQAFLEDMIIHHQGAVAMAQELQHGTNRPELQKMATDIITVQTAEIEMMRQWLKEWFVK